MFYKIRLTLPHSEQEQENVHAFLSEGVRERERWGGQKCRETRQKCWEISKTIIVEYVYIVKGFIAFISRSPSLFRKLHTAHIVLVDFVVCVCLHPQNQRNHQPPYSCL